MSQEYSCPKCVGKVRNRGSFTPRYFRLKDRSEVGYIYHQVIDNQGRLRQHSIGVKAPSRSPKSDISKGLPLLDTSEIQVLEKLHKRLIQGRNTTPAKIIEKILQHLRHGMGHVS